MIRVVIVDDHKLLRQGVRVLLEGEPDFQVVGEASSGPEGLKLVETTQPDIALVDLLMPRMNDLDLTRRIKQSVPQTSVIIVSMYDDPSYVHQALKEGASGYVIKGSGIEELITAIQQVREGKRYLSTSLPPLARAQLEAE